MKLTPHHYKSATGLTLVEMMITVAIIAILAAVAWPMYNEQSRKNKRSDAVGALTSAYQAMQQRRSDTGGYAAGALNSYLPQAPNAPVVDCKSNRGYQIGGGGGFQSCEGYYTITVAVPDADTFTLTATPTGGWADPQCTTLSINQLRVKNSTGSAPTERCWSK